MMKNLNKKKYAKYFELIYKNILFAKHIRKKQVIKAVRV